LYRYGQALSALVIIAISMSLLMTRPYKRYRKKILEFIILFSHGLVLLMSALSLAPVTSDISQESKDQFAEIVFLVIVVTYITIVVFLTLSLVEEFPIFVKAETALRNYHKQCVQQFYATLRLEPPAWAGVPAFDLDEPMKSVFKPSTVAALGAAWNQKNRCAFAKAIQSLLRHREVRAVHVEFSVPNGLKAPGFNPRTYEVKIWFQSLLSKFNLCRYSEVEVRLMQRDNPLMSFPTLFSPLVRGGAVPVESSETQSLKPPGPGFNP
jgi:hypothetical protein